MTKPTEIVINCIAGTSGSGKTRKLLQLAFYTDIKKTLVISTEMNLEEYLRLLELSGNDIITGLKGLTALNTPTFCTVPYNNIDETMNGLLKAGTFEGVSTVLVDGVCSCDYVTWLTKNLSTKITRIGYTQQVSRSQCEL